MSMEEMIKMDALKNVDDMIAIDLGKMAAPFSATEEIALPSLPSAPSGPSRPHQNPLFRPSNEFPTTTSPYYP